MASKKAPAFQFYADSWLASTDILLMSPSEEGAYIRLLATAWMQPDCGLPVCDAELAVMSRLGKGWMKSRARILAKFDEVDGRYFNLRLLEERNKQEEHRKASSRGGKKGSDSRWNDKGTHAPVIVHSSQKNDPRETDEDKVEEVVLRGDSKGEPDFDPLITIQHWLQQYVQEFGIDWGLPDAGICMKVFMGLNGSSLDDLESFLRELYGRKQRPTKHYGWFVTVVSGHFESLNGTKASA